MPGLPIAALLMLILLKQAEQLGALSALDYHFARFIAPQQGPVALAAALLSRESRAGHVCCPLRWLSQPEQWFDGRFPTLANALWQQAQQPNQAIWESLLQYCDAVGDGDTSTPLILDHQHLYLHRLWCDERDLAHFFRQTELPVAPDSSQLRSILNQLFSDCSVSSPEINWQKVAVAVALTRKTALIVGGPGSGKTTTIARLLAAWIALYTSTAATRHASVGGHAPRLRIQLAAATGKAAARLSEALAHARQTLPVDAAISAQMPTEALTLHRLLGAQSDRQSWRYHRGNPLALDLLIIDEVSLIALPLMARLVEALSEHTHLILLGDSDQLAAVETGALLSDLVNPVDQSYSAPRATELSLLTGYPLQATAPHATTCMSDSLCQLRTRYRFQAYSPIARLATVIQRGDATALPATLQQSSSALHWQSVTQDNYSALLQAGVQGYRDYLERARSGEEPWQVAAAFARFRLLCALREGPFGLNGLNHHLEQALQQAGLITLTSNNPWYTGRPVLITANHYPLGLFNGDIGITLPDEQGRLRVYFIAPHRSVIAIAPSRLPAHQTSYALTVHKAQGSEFEQLLLLLPPSWSQLLTRELLYTAITRAKNRLTLYADMTVLQAMVNSRCERFSRLAQRLKS
jgi:exodeoxyribonuclease V alpha subunit